MGMEQGPTTYKESALIISWIPIVLFQVIKKKFYFLWMVFNIVFHFGLLHLNFFAYEHEVGVLLCSWCWGPGQWLSSFRSRMLSKKGCKVRFSRTLLQAARVEPVSHKKGLE